MRLAHLVLAAAVVALPACYVLEPRPGHDPIAEAGRGASQGAAMGAPFGPWGELAGAALGGLIAGGGAVHIAHKSRRKVAGIDARDS